MTLPNDKAPKNGQIVKKKSQNYNLWMKPVLYEIDDFNFYGA